jgi:hypothetical protein
MFGDLLKRIEAAADAFLAPVPAGPLRPTRKHVAEGMPGGPPLPKLTDVEQQALQEQALGLLDPEVRGWLIVVVRDAEQGADIDVDWQMPEAAWPAVGACLFEASPQ